MTYYTLAGLLMLSGALVGFVDLIRPHLHTQSTTTEKTADQTGRRFTHSEVLDERNTTR
jgi:hypothetical protein